MTSDVRFTRAQKWDLVRMSAAALASTVFFTVPMFLVPPNAPAPSTQKSITAPATDVMLAGLSNPIPPSTPAESAAVRANAEAVMVVTSTEFAATTRPVLQGNITPRARATRPGELRARANPTASSPSLRRRLARLISGNGKYTIKPFPTVSTSGS
jgi:hypothetical protein